MTDNIDILMDLDPLQMTKEDIDSIIAYHRKQRAAAATGRPKKDLGPSPKVDLAALGLKSDPKGVDASFRRRF